jgi:SRSO17 transposase
MDLQSTDGSEARFTAYVEGLGSVIGHADRAGPLRAYCLGLIMPCERKSVEPTAAVTAPGPDGSAAPVAAAFRRPVALVEREGLGESGRNGSAVD